MNKYMTFLVFILFLSLDSVLAQDNSGVKLTPSEQDLFFAGVGFEISDSYAFIQGLTKTHVFRREGENWARHQPIEHNAKNSSLSVSWGPLDLSGNNLLYSATDATNAIYTTLDFTMGEATGYKSIFPPIADDPSQRFLFDPRLQNFSRLDGKNLIVLAWRPADGAISFYFYRDIGIWILLDALAGEELITDGGSLLATSLSQDWAIICSSIDENELGYKLHFLKREDEQWHLKKVLERPNANFQALGFHKSNVVVRTTSSVIIYGLNFDEWQKEFTYKTKETTGDVDVHNDIVLDSNSGVNSGAVLLRRTLTTTGDISWQGIAEFKPIPGSSAQKVSLSDNYALLGFPGEAYVYKIPKEEPPRISIHNNWGIYKAFPKLLIHSELNAERPEPVKICADGADNATLISIAGSIPNIDDLALVIKEDLEHKNEAEYGSFSLFETFEDSIVFRYRHPRIVRQLILRELTLQVVTNVDQNTALYEYPIHLYHAPVTTIHGLWGDGGSFSKMRKAFGTISGPLFLPFALINSVAYPASNDQHFRKNVSIIANGISFAVDQAIEFGYSAGKTNIVAHSMGGILTRLFIQSAAYDSSVSRFITVNTPHAGSQIANYLIEDECGQVIAAALDLDIVGMNTKGGAVADLRVDGSAIRSFLNGANLNRNKVPSHAIVTTAIVTDEISLDNWAGYILMLNLKLYIAAGYGLLEVTELVKAIFAFGLNDVIVATDSQNGGLSRITTFPGISHVGVTDAPEVVTAVKTLLSQDPENASIFSMNGFHPQPIEYTFDGSAFEIPCSIVPAKSSLVQTLEITSPPNESVVRPGESVTVVVSGADGFSSLLFAAGNKTIGHSLIFDDTFSGIFTYEVPHEAAGLINIGVIAVSNGQFIHDQIVVNVEVQANLDSLSVFPKRARLVLGDVPFSVTGFFADSVSRDLTLNPNTVYTIDNNNIARFRDTSVVTAVSAGTTRARISFDGNQIESEVIVHPTAIITNVELDDEQSRKEDLPLSVILKQNYPNPFNATTTITYEIKKASQVSLVIYNILGKKVVTLVNRPQGTGEYKINWNGTDDVGTILPSGIYFYELQVRKNERTIKKMLLLK